MASLALNLHHTIALMEYHGNKEKDVGKDVAGRIFEKGMAEFGDEVDYALKYLGFLISVNDETS